MGLWLGAGRPLCLNGNHSSAAIIRISKVEVGVSQTTCLFQGLIFVLRIALKSVRQFITSCVLLFFNVAAFLLAQRLKRVKNQTNFDQPSALGDEQIIPSSLSCSCVSL